MPLVIPNVAEVPLPSIWSIIPVDVVAPALAYIQSNPLLMTFFAAQAAAVVLPIALLSAVLLFLITSLVAISLCVAFFWGVVGGILCVPLIIVLSVLFTVIWSLGALGWAIYSFAVKGKSPNDILGNVPFVNKLQDRVGGIKLPGVPEGTVDGVRKNLNATAGGVTGGLQSATKGVAPEKTLNKVGEGVQGSVGSIGKVLGLQSRDEASAEPQSEVPRKMSSPLSPTKLSSGKPISPPTSPPAEAENMPKGRRWSEHTMVDDNFDDSSEPLLDHYGKDEPKKAGGLLGGDGADIMRSIERSLY